MILPCWERLSLLSFDLTLDTIVSPADISKEGYGDYIISMEEYLEAYFEAVEQDQEYNCEYEKEYGDCNCQNADDEEICEYDCYMGKGMEYCVDRNPYAEDGEEEEEKVELREYAECSNLEIQDNNGRRKLEQEEVEYFMGAYWYVRKVFYGYPWFS